MGATARDFKGFENPVHQLRHGTVSFLLFPVFHFMSAIQFVLADHGDDAYVALCDLLKLTGIASSGGQGKLMVAAGEVTVDGQAESRKRAKIRVGQLVECLGQRILVAPKEGV